MGRRSQNGDDRKAGRENDMDRFSVDNFERPVLETPNNSKKILMHSCCAPCAAEVMDALAASGDRDDDFFLQSQYSSPR